MMATPLGQHNATLPVHFFKIILNTNVERITLEYSCMEFLQKIPNTFAKQYGDCLSDPVCLRPPDLKEFKVHWTRRENGDVWLEKGWKEFVENYSLKNGHFVVFKYEGASMIDVLILDRSALEIDYSSDYYVEEMSSDESDKILEENPRERQSGRHMIVKRNPKYHKLDSAGGVQSRQGKKLKKNRKHRQEAQITCLNMPKTLKAQQLTRKFESENPFFTLIIKKSQLEENAKKWVPRFLDIESNKKSVMLEYGTRIWCVQMIRVRGKNYDLFSSGWSVFAKESKLQDGDICIFELTDPSSPLLEVTKVWPI
ncbi:hypothetical protein VNO78_02632 [Psophocarpus tetragonolobus]|uniref:TF-B3 domain-containing protein n=1 Tax=Psophocarpus tetragonolobus TaxID=3891 RepID=A0AAN9TCD8_PSOTE